MFVLPKLCLVKAINRGGLIKYMCVNQKDWFLNSVHNLDEFQKRFRRLWVQVHNYQQLEDVHCWTKDSPVDLSVRSQ